MQPWKREGTHVTRPQLLSIPERFDANADFTGRGVVIAFVDSGFFPHPDLFRPARRMRGYVDVTRDVPVASEFYTPSFYSWHGTMAACCAAGSGYLSGGRYRGLAADAEVVLIRTAGEHGIISGKNVATAIRVPLRHPELGIRVMNVSLGVSLDDPDVADVDRAITEVVRAGVTVFAAAGNSPDRPPEPPATSPLAITVGGSDDQGTRDPGDDSTYPSSHGLHKPDLLAPAARMPAPMLPGTLVAREAIPLFQLMALLEEESCEQEMSRRSGDEVPEGDRLALEAIMAAVDARISHRKYISTDYQHVDGTSFASPIVASVAAQMLEANPRLEPRELREGLLTTAKPLLGVARSLQGAGVVQPAAAVAWAIARRG